ncbi:MAG: hypothetical protein ACRDXE_03255 [Acidimicrobiales bacterium]
MRKSGLRWLRRRHPVPVAVEAIAWAVLALGLADLTMWALR